jgi:hypothetical protein
MSEDGNTSGAGKGKGGDIPEPDDPFSRGVLGEGLLSSGLVRLFGRPYYGLKIDDLGANPTSNNPLIGQLRAGVDAQLARIYGFTYLGNYYKLPEPTIYLVFGEGWKVPSGFRVPEIATGIVGTEQKIFDFDEGLRMWVADQLDITVRVTTDIGWVKDLLLEPNVTEEASQTSDARRSELVGRAALVGNAALVGRDRSR